MSEPERIGTLPISRLAARPSRSFEASKRREIELDLALTPLERVKKALEMGRTLAQVQRAHAQSDDS